MQGYYEICRTQGQHVSERGEEVQHTVQMCVRDDTDHIYYKGTEERNNMVPSHGVYYNTVSFSDDNVSFWTPHLVARVKSSGDMK